MTTVQGTWAKAPASIPQVLIFNFPEDERTAEIRSFLDARGILARTIAPSDQRQTLGFLLGLPGSESRQAQLFSPRFSDEMLVMSGFSQADLDAFLKFFRSAGLKRVELKAILTPTNASWDAFTLHRHLSQERDAFAARSKQP